MTFTHWQVSRRAPLGELPEAGRGGAATVTVWRLVVVIATSLRHALFLRDAGVQALHSRREGDGAPLGHN